MKCDDIICDRCGKRIKDYPHNPTEYETYKITIDKGGYYTYIWQSDLCLECSKENWNKVQKFLDEYFVFKSVKNHY